MATTFNGALIKEQGVTFAIVIVKQHVLKSPNIEKVRNSFAPFFPNVPIILMAQDVKGTPEYHGCKDIAKFLANTPISRIPFKKYTVS